MNRNHSIIYIFLSSVLFLTSCVREIEELNPKPQITSEHIVFGGALDNDIVVTRSGDKQFLEIIETSLHTETGDVSLPLVVRVEQGIKTYCPSTKAAITTEIDDITDLDAWATKNTYKDQSKEEVLSRTMFFTGSDGKAETGALFTKETGNEDINGDGKVDDIFYPKNNGPYLWEKNSSAISDFQFVAVSPDGCGFEAKINEATKTVTFDYTVPSSALNHKDILVAYPDPVPVNYGQSVPLDFKHVLSAVNVKVGNNIPSGVIKSIKFIGVYNHGSYFPESNEWTNLSVENGGEFSVILPEGGFVVSPESNGADITNVETSFMMIPQQLYTGAEIVVEFKDNLTNKDYILRASIQGNVWDQNTTTNYLINIDDNYNINVVPLDNLLDSHYIITKVEVSSEYPYWTLSAVADDRADVTLQLESEVNELAKAGFWTDKVAAKQGNTYYATDVSARGTASTAGTQTSSQIVYVFIPENISGKVRNVTLELLGLGSDGSMSQPKTITLKQNPVMWLKDPMNTGNQDAYWGCELLLEGGQVGWGFCWDGLNATFILKQGGASYDKENDEYGEGQIPKGQDKKIKPAMELAGINVDRMTDPNYYIQVAEGGTKSEYYIRVDLSKIALDVADKLDNGWINTVDLYNWEGISSLSQLIEFCKSWGDITNPDGRATLIQESLEYAALYAMKRNRFLYYKETIDEVGKDMTIPVILEKDIKWYLPAVDQFPYFMNEKWGQAFTFNDLFWTSTAYLEQSETYKAHSYAYVNGIPTISHRNDQYLTFALRYYTLQDNVEIGGGNTIVPGGGNGPEYGEGGSGGDNTGGNIGGGTN